MSRTEQVCVVTGSSSGTGLVTARELARTGAAVVMLCRSATKAHDVRTAIVAATGNERVDVVVADLAEMHEVRRAAAEIQALHGRVDVLVNNAGALASSRCETSEGLEVTFAGNYLGHFLLTRLLLDDLTSAEQGRVVNVSSSAHKWTSIAFDDLQSERSSMTKAYGQSKLAQLLFTYELARRLEGTSTTVNAVHPGPVSSGFKNGTTGVRRVIANAIYGVIGISTEKGADTILYLAESPEVAQVSGKYFVKRKAVPSNRDSYDVALQQRLWRVSAELISDVDPV